jgi:hypothetical protein
MRREKGGTILQWTNEERRLLKLMIEKEFSLREMASILKSRSAEAIRAQICQLGLVMPQSRVDIDYDAYEALISNSQEAKKL